MFRSTGLFSNNVGYFVYLKFSSFFSWKKSLGLGEQDYTTDVLQGGL